MFTGNPPSNSSADQNKIQQLMTEIDQLKSQVPNQAALMNAEIIPIETGYSPEMEADFKEIEQLLKNYNAVLDKQRFATPESATTDKEEDERLKLKSICVKQLLIDVINKNFNELDTKWEGYSKIIKAHRDDGSEWGVVGNWAKSLYNSYVPSAGETLVAKMQPVYEDLVRTAKKQQSNSSLP